MEEKRSNFYTSLFLLLTIAFSACDGVDASSSDSLQIVVLSYNIHHAEGLDGRIDLARIANTILSANPDIVALQEVDRYSRRSGSVDQAAELGRLTGMEMVFGFAMNYKGGKFGNVILSKHPVQISRIHPLPGLPGEPRVLLEAHISLPQGGGDEELITFFSTHLDTKAAPRTDALPLIEKAMPANPDGLVILAGDLNAMPGSPTMDRISTRWLNATAEPTLLTAPAQNPDRQIDYILYLGGTDWTATGADVLDEPMASDHLPILARFTKNP